MLYDSYRSFSEKLLQLTLEFKAYGEAPAGSRAEYRLVKRIREAVEEEAGVQARLNPVHVVEWRDEGSWIEACGRHVEALALPQTVGGSFDDKLVFIGSVERLEKTDNIEGVALIEAYDPDEIQSMYLEAVEKGASAIVFYDPLPGRLRRFVVTGKWSYSFTSPAPATTPALYIRREDAVELAKCSGARIHVHHGGRLIHSTGYIVEAAVYGGEDELLITAHHDHWLTGVNDNLAGVALAVLTLAALKDRVGRVTLRFVSFTAEEFGDPSLPAWYWSYGSRWYVSALKAADRLENIVAVLNYDVASTRSPKVYVSGLLFRSLVERIASIAGVSVGGFDNSYTDSYSFSREGVPAASIIDLEGLREVYHSDMDDVGYLSIEGAWRSFKTFYMVGERLLEKGHSALEYYSYGSLLLDTVSEARATIHVREEAYRLLRILEKVGGSGECSSIVRRLVRRLESQLIRAVFEGDYRTSSGGFETRFLPELLILDDLAVVEEAKRLLRTDRAKAINLLRSLPPTRIAVGDEEELPSLGSHALTLTGVVDAEHVLDLLVRAGRYAASRAGRLTASKIAEVVDELLAYCLAGK